MNTVVVFLSLLLSLNFRGNPIAQQFYKDVKEFVSESDWEVEFVADNVVSIYYKKPVRYAAGQPIRSMKYDYTGTYRIYFVFESQQEFKERVQKIDDGTIFTDSIAVPSVEKSNISLDTPPAFIMDSTYNFQSKGSYISVLDNKGVWVTLHNDDMSSETANRLYYFLYDYCKEKYGATYVMDNKDDFQLYTVEGDLRYYFTKYKWYKAL